MALGVLLGELSSTGPSMAKLFWRSIVYRLIDI